MRAGTLDARIALQRKSTSYSSTGEPTDAWTTLGERWALVEPASGDERSASEQWVAREQTKFTIRWSQEFEDLSPLDQVIFPVGDASESPVPTRSIYDVIAVHQIGRNYQMTILAARRVA